MTTQEIQSIKQRFGIIGNSAQLNYAIQVAAQVAATNMTVLITGESGTGKESFSKIIHQLSGRKHGPFIAVNCGAIPEGTIDSELFGHEKGSFTGASDARKGYFEVTDGGTIFLDEVGEMPMGTQARLLRILENGEYIRVGSSKVQKTDVRIVTATNVNLIRAVEEKKFREDLYYRLNTVPINVPPLRERGEDIYLLFRKFASDFSEKYRIDPIKLTKEAQVVLAKYRFPGNIRQLKNIVDQMSLLEIERDCGPEALVKYLPDFNQTSALAKIGNGSFNQSENFSERDILFKVLFDLKRDFTELKGLFLEFVKNPTNGEQIINTHPELFRTYSQNLNNDAEINRPMLMEPTIEKRDTFQHIDENEPKIEDISHEEENESLSLIQIEKELIIKALKKYKGKRKPASDELGISERTLYRKLKEYDLEHL
ncbi:MAG: sigma-54 dependent transcriptional regulator [Bacteroidota bacterium]|nr:sigma-54 dependent transcriptional regulator [Bacteroidota bacterium]